MLKIANKLEIKMNIKLFSESDFECLSQSRVTYYSPNDISDKVNQIYILNFMLFKQNILKFF